MSYYNEQTYKAAKAYKEKNIKRVPLDMQKDRYDELKAVADAVGEKVNEYIKKAIEQRMEREKETAPGEGFHIADPDSGTEG